MHIPNRVFNLTTHATKSSNLMNPCLSLYRITAMLKAELLSLYPVKMKVKLCIYKHFTQKNCWNLRNQINTMTDHL